MTRMTVGELMQLLSTHDPDKVALVDVGEGAPSGDPRYATGVQSYEDVLIIEGLEAP